MHCVVSAGPTFEPLDGVRRLTNFSTGRLGTDLACFLCARGHTVTLLLGVQSTWPVPSPRSGLVVERFTTTTDLRDRLHRLGSNDVHAVFHTAAVSDFSFGRVFTRDPEGHLNPFTSGKFTTRAGPLLAELLPTPKIIASLRSWFPAATLVGWKYEVDGSRASVLSLAEKQMQDCKTDGCVANGPAYGPGFCLVRHSGSSTHLGDMNALFAALSEMLPNT